MKRFKSMSNIASTTPFPQFKTTGDGKHDVEVYNEDLTDGFIIQNWLDPSKETEAAKWTKPEKAMAYLPGSEQTAHGYQRPERVLRSNYRSLGGKAEIYFLAAK